MTEVLIALIGIMFSGSLLSFFHLDKKIENLQKLIFKIGTKIGALDDGKDK